MDDAINRQQTNSFQFHVLTDTSAAHLPDLTQVQQDPLSPLKTQFLVSHLVDDRQVKHV